MKSKLNKLLLLSILFLGTNIGFSQVYRFKTSTVAVILKNEKGSWGEWSKPKEANLVVSVDDSKNRIIVYSEVIQLFEIVEYVAEKFGKTEDKAVFICKNNEGESCQISFVTKKEEGNRKELFIAYEDRIISYDIKYLK